MSDERTSAAAAPDQDLRASIAGALAASRGQSEQPPPPAEPVEKPADEAAQQPPAEAPPTERPPGAPAEPAEPDKPAAASPDDGRVAKGAEEAAKTPLGGDTAAPQHWSTEDKAEFARISSAEEARQWGLKHYKRMEAGFGQKLQRAAQLERDYGPLDQTIFTPDQRQLIERQGATVNQVINNWANIERVLDRGTNSQNQELRNQILARMIYNYGGEPGRIAGLLQEFYDYHQQTLAQRGMAAGYVPGLASDAAGQPNGAAPAAGNGLDSRIAMLEAHNFEQQRRIVEAFGSAKGAGGELLHPYFGEVRAKMSELARIQESQGQLPDLEALYTEAVWATDSTRGRLLSSQRQAEERRTAEERLAKAERAGRAGVSVNGAPGPGQAPLAVPDRTLRDEIRANLSNYRH
jgi:hypothetical protein